MVSTNLHTCSPTNVYPGLPKPEAVSDRSLKLQAMAAARAAKKASIEKQLNEALAGIDALVEDEGV
eukprot:m.267599 g.267599  ORF g.267599 m.267599 type:complete len:66 (+) comp16249_c0_seq12:1418-1615(+)